MIEMWRKHWIASCLGLSFILGALSVFNLWQYIGHPFGGFVIGRDLIENFRVPDMSTPPWWPGMNHTSLLPGDKLIILDGQPYDRNDGTIYAAAHNRGEASVSLTVERNGVPIEMNVPVVLFTVSNLIDLKVPGLINGLGLWLLALVVYRANPKEPVNYLFAIASIVVATHRWLSFPGLFLDIGALTNILEIIQVMMAPLIGVLIIHFIMLYPKPSRLRMPPVLYGLAIIGLSLSVAFGVARLLWWQSGWSPLVAFLTRLGYHGALFLLSMAMIFVFARFTWLLLHSRSAPRLRRQLLFILLGFIVTLPLIILLIVAGAAETTYIFWNQLDLRYLLLAVPLAFAYVILRYQALHSTHPLFLGVFIFASSALLASTGTWLLRLSQPALVNSSTFPPFMLILGITLAVSAFWSLQGSWRGVFGRLFQWEVRSYTAVKQFGQKVIEQIDLAVLPSTIATALVSELNLEQSAVWLWQPTEKAFILAGQAGRWIQLPERLPAPADSIVDGQWPLRLNMSNKTIPEWLQTLSQSGPVEVISPLSIAARPIGLLALGKRWDEEIFDERDLEIIELIAQQSALFLLAAMQVDELRQVPRRVAEAQERERYKIAQELHDTIQQFLGRLPFYLEVSRSAIWTEPAETEQLLERCIADVERAAGTVRLIRSNLAPSQLVKGVVRPLKELITRFERRTGIKTLRVIAPDLDRCTTLEARHALYRVVQQALDNVTAHADATLVEIEITQAEGKTNFAIADNGRGFSPQERQQAQAQGSFGLESMRARIDALSGELHFSSALGQGTRIIGWLPTV